MNQKTLTDLYDEVHIAKHHQMLDAIHYFNYNREYNNYYVPEEQKLDVLSLEFKYDCNIEKVKAMESQAIARALRIGQKSKVSIVRFITKGTVEEEHFNKNRYDMSILQN